MACAYGTRKKSTSPLVIYISGADVGLWLSGAGDGWLDPVVSTMLAFPVALDAPFSERYGL